MKDNDFDEIGKRLYDQEADPPGDGWKRIRAGITPPEAGGKTLWAKRNFWKSLVLIIPLAVYLFLQRTPAQDAKLTSAPSAENVPAKAENNHAEVSDGDLQPPAKPSEPAPAPTREENEVVVREVVGKMEANKAPSAFTLPLDIAQEGSLEVSLDADGKTKSLVTNNPDKAVAADEPNLEQSATAVHSFGEKDPVDKAHIALAFPLANEKPTVLQPDSIKTQARDTNLSEENVEEAEQETKGGEWRISASFIPHYVGQSARPIIDDEVFVTNIEDQRKKLYERIGLGFALGAGKVVSRNLYIDAHFSFSTTAQNSSYSYSTGNVDTLLALQQPDRSVRIIPVYKVTIREYSTKYTYGGIRLSATYYFLSTAHGKFNVTGGAGIHYLLSSTVKEKADGQWITLDSDELNKANYTLTAGAGYSRRLSKRWELMINPTITYHLRQLKNDQLPYRLNQNPFGLNVMLSRTFGKM